MLAGSRNILYTLLVLLELVCIVIMLAAYGYLGLTWLPALVLLMLRKPRLHYILTLTSGFALTALVNNVYASFMSILVALVGSFYYVLNCRKENEVRIIHVALLIHTPLYVISPRTVIPAMASLLAYLIQILREHFRLGKSHVYLFAPNPAVHLNDNVDIVLEVKCPGRFKYRVQVDDSTYLVRDGTDSVLDVVRVKATRLGLIRHVVKVALTDPRGLVKVVHGPYVLEYVVVPKFSEFIRRVERILHHYAEYVTAPLISIVTLQPGFSGGLGGISRNEKTSRIETGIHAVPVTTAKSKEHPRIAEGAEVPGKMVGEQYTDTNSTQLGALRGVLKHVKIKMTWKTPRKILERTSQVVKTYIGEYLGVREYQPGDSLRMIHWKKSFRRDDVLDLAVKDYSSGEIEKRRGGEKFIVLADLTATSPEELDLLLQALYGQLLSIVKNTGRALSELYLYLITPRGETYFLKGKVVDILSALNALVLEEKYTSLYNYNSWHRRNPPIKGGVTGFLEQLVEYYRSHGHALVKDLNSWGLEKGSVVLIYSKALSFKYYVVATALKEHGFATTTPGAHFVNKD